jgi:hypothetical protein
MAAHASDWGDSLIQRCRGEGKQNTMVMMFVGGVVLLFDGISILFLQWEIYDAGVFHSRLYPYRGKAVKTNDYFISLFFCRKFDDQAPPTHSPSRASSQ